MTEYPFVPLGELAASNRGAIAIGPFGSRMKADVYVSEGVSVIRGTNIGRDRALKGDWVFVTDQFADGIANCVVQPGDIVFPHRGSIGEVALIEEHHGRMVLSSSMMKFTPDPQKADSEYLYYYFRSIAGRDEILRFGSQVGTPGIGQPLASLRQFRAPLPDLPVQRAIAQLLGSLDDKIELNRRMNETLEAMAQAIFRDWFVDFGPTRRKLDGATDPVEIMGGLVAEPDRARELADLFPATLGDDGLPEGWSYSSLGEVFNIKIGRTPPRKEQQHFTSAGDGVPWMSIRDLGDCGVFIRDTAEGLTPDAVGRFRVPVIDPDTVVVSFKLTVGRVAITEGRMLSNEAIAHLGATSCTQSPWFTYLWMQQFDYSRLGSTSSIATAVNSKSIKTIEFPIVGAALLSAFHDLVDPIFCMIRSKSNEGRTLAATRDLLLPKLMSGEVRLSDAEAAVEAAQ